MGRKFQVKTDDGDVIKGRLKSFDGVSLVLEELSKKKEAIEHNIPMLDVKEARVMLEF